MAELHDIMEGNVFPILLGGDFNLVRNAKEKINERINAQWSYLFIDRINIWSLVELRTANRLYTWANNQDNLILATLYRIFVSIDWDQNLPLSTVTTLYRTISDHTPLLLDTRNNKSPPPKMFRFEGG